MILVGKYILDEFTRSKKGRAVKKLVNVWVNEVEKANWKDPTDVKACYPTASILQHNRIIFNIRGNKFRVSVVVSYIGNVVNIEWIGDHDEYNKMDFTKPEITSK